MQHPQFLYYAAITLIALIEGGLWVRRRFWRLPGEAFGRVVWVLVAVFLIALIACNLGYALPPIQLWLHLFGLIAGFAISRNLPGHLTAAVFAPMASVDYFCVLGIIEPHTWWWAIYWLAFAQLLPLAAGAEFHPLGRWIRAWAQRTWKNIEMRMAATWRHAWVT